VKGLSLILNLIFISCSTQKIQKPSWVAALESGESSMKMELDNEYFFRAIHKTEVKDPQVCDLAVDKAYQYALNEYTSKEGIPYKVMVIFEFNEGMSCAATISINKKDLIELNKLQELKEKFEEEKTAYQESVKKELELVEKDRIYYMNERNRLLKEKEEIKMYISQNTQIKEEIYDIKNKIQKAINDKNNEANKIKDRVFYGMSYREFLDITETDSIHLTFDLNSPCYEKNSEKATHQSTFRFFHVCWKKQTYRDSSAILVGLCDIRTKSCIANLNTTNG
jgi:hypothetical protein